jgi:chromosome segregation ATPase
MRTEVKKVHKEKGTIKSNNYKPKQSPDLLKKLISVYTTTRHNLIRKIDNNEKQINRLKISLQLNQENLEEINRKLDNANDNLEVWK